MCTELHALTFTAFHIYLKLQLLHFQCTVAQFGVFLYFLFPSNFPIQLIYCVEAAALKLSYNPTNVSQIVLNRKVSVNEEKWKSTFSIGFVWRNGKGRSRMQQ